MLAPRARPCAPIAERWRAADRLQHPRPGPAGHDPSPASARTLAWVLLNGILGGATGSCLWHVRDAKESNSPAAPQSSGCTDVAVGSISRRRRNDSDAGFPRPAQSKRRRQLLPCADGSSAAGKRTRNTLPRSPSLASSMCPPFASIAQRAIARPSPIPPSSLERPASMR